MHLEVRRSETLALLFVFACCASARSQDTQVFRNKEAREAQKAYLSDIAAAQKRFEEDSKAARARYVESLVEAAKIIVDSGDLDEVTVIKKDKTVIKKDKIESAFITNSLIDLRQRLRGTTWTFNRPGKDDSITFNNDGTVSVSRTKSIDGHPQGKWWVVDEQLVCVRVVDVVFFFRFDDKFAKYNVLMGFKRIEAGPNEFVASQRRLNR